MSLAAFLYRGPPTGVLFGSGAVGSVAGKAQRLGIGPALVLSRRGTLRPRRWSLPCVEEAERIGLPDPFCVATHDFALVPSDTAARKPDEKD